jgi:predicted RNase H-like HicB family nuclease
MKFLVSIVKDEDGVYIAECPSIPGCFSQGSTEEEAEINIQEAIKECLEVRAEMGMPLTVAVKQVEVALESISQSSMSPFSVSGFTPPK